MANKGEQRNSVVLYPSILHLLSLFVALFSTPYFLGDKKRSILGSKAIFFERSSIPWLDAYLLPGEQKCVWIIEDLGGMKFYTDHKIKKSCQLFLTFKKSCIGFM